MAAQYRVINQKPTIDITPFGEFVDVIEVTAETPTGAVFTIRVPVSRYEPDGVAAQLADMAARIETVAGL